MHKYSVMGCLGLALALMLSAGFAQAEAVSVKYESVQYADMQIDMPAMVAKVKSVDVLQARLCSQHDFTIGSNFRASSAGMVLATVGGQRSMRTATIVYTG